MADLITWSDKLNTGVPSVDEQHKKLVSMVNRMNHALLTGKANETVGRVLDDLIDYTASHFQHEERLMTTHDFPGYNEHKRQHDELKQNVLDLQRRFNEGSARLNVEVMVFLRNWLKGHIMGSDAAIGAFLTSKGAM